MRLAASLVQTSTSRAYCVQAVLAEEVGRVGPELVRILDEGPAVDVADVRAALRSEQVEPAQRLAKGEDHLSRDLLLVVVEDERVAQLLAARVANHLTVHDRRLARLRRRHTGMRSHGGVRTRTAG